MCEVKGVVICCQGTILSCEVAHSTHRGEETAV